MAIKNTEGKIIVTNCCSCKGDRNHKILACRRLKIREEDYNSDTDYMIVQCLGCNNISFLEECSSDDMLRIDGNGEPEYYSETSVYPQKDKVDSIKNVYYIPPKIRLIYQESIKALNNDCLNLASAGFRAVIEVVCSNKEIKEKTLDKKINKLFKDGFITKDDRDRLHAVRFIGNDSIHEIKAPTEEELILVFQIINNLLNNLYITERVIGGNLVKPIKRFEDFTPLLLEEIEKKVAGDSVFFSNIWPNNRLLIKDDMPLFEKKLIEKIESGDFNKLKLLSSSSGKQEYEVL